MHLSRININNSTGGPKGGDTVRVGDSACQEGPQVIEEAHPENAGQNQDESAQDPPPIHPHPIDRGMCLRI